MIFSTSFYFQALCLLVFFYYINDFTISFKLVFAHSVLVFSGACLLTYFLPLNIAYYTVLPIYIFVSLKTKNHSVMFSLFSMVVSLLTFSLFALLINFLFFSISLLFSISYSENILLFFESLSCLITTFIGCKLSPKIELNYLYTTLLAPFTSKKIVLIRPFVFSALLLLAILYKIIYLSNLTDSNMVSLFLFIVTLVTLLLFYTSYKAINAKREIENERLIRQTEINGLHQYTKELENTISTLREFRHDYINILTTLEYGIKNNDMQTIKTVFERTISPTKEILSKTNINLFKLDILEPELKSILASKFIQISSKNIPFDFYITDSLKETGIDYIDLVRILSILLDNAFEETITQENPQIQVGIIKVDPACEIIIQNTIDDAVSVDEIFQKNYSTKHAHYGIGLYSVADIISKYHHVTLETMSDEKLFTQKIVIMNGE